MQPETSTGDSWRHAAACLTMDPDLFFPVSTAGRSAHQVRRAKAVCATCLVRLPCLQEALATEQAYGVWGGLSEEERWPIIQKQRGNGRPTGLSLAQTGAEVS
jgi:WhiB family transcriptional regulator, redox-sensing transcriptional regulator